MIPGDRSDKVKSGCHTTKNQVEPGKHPILCLACIRDRYRISLQCCHIVVHCSPPVENTVEFLVRKSIENVRSMNPGTGIISVPQVRRCSGASVPAFAESTPRIGLTYSGGNDGQRGIAQATTRSPAVGSCPPGA